MKWSSSIRTRLIVSFSMMVLGVSAFLGVASYLGAARIVESEAVDTLRVSAERLADVYGAWIDAQLRELATLAANADIEYGPGLDARLASEAKRLGYNSIAPADLAGRLHLSGGRTADLSKRAYLQSVLATRKPAVSEPVYSAVAGEENMLTVLFAVPILRSGDLAGVLVGQRNAEFLSAAIGSVAASENSDSFAIDAKGSMLAHSDPEIAKLRLKPEDFAANPDLESLLRIIEAMSKGERGHDIYELDGVVRFVAYAPVGELGWSVAISEDAESVRAPMASLRSASMITAGVGIALGIVAAVVVGAGLARPIASVTSSFERLAEGDADLTKRLEHSKADEIGELVIGFNGFVGKLRTIVQSLKSTQDSLGAVGEDLASSAHESAGAISQIMANIEGVRRQAAMQQTSADRALADMRTIAEGVGALDRLTETQSAGIVEASASIEQMIGNIGSVGASTERMAERFASLAGTSSSGKSKQEAAAASAKDIAAQSASLMEANDAVASIAKQTNLLAMNAAIEAAHAGEAGKGFSVVADEIRRLSETASEQSRTIGNELGKIRRTIEAVVAASAESEQAFGLVASGIDETGELVRQVESAMAEQREGSKQILEALRDMNEAAEAVRERASGMSSGASSATEGMNSLVELTSSIRGSMDEMGAGAQEINKAAQAVSDLALRTKDSIASMEESIGRFTV